MSDNIPVDLVFVYKQLAEQIDTEPILFNLMVSAMVTGSPAVPTLVLMVKELAKALIASRQRELDAFLRATHPILINAPIHSGFADKGILCEVRNGFLRNQQTVATEQERQAGP